MGVVEEICITIKPFHSIEIVSKNVIRITAYFRSSEIKYNDNGDEKNLIRTISVRFSLTSGKEIPIPLTSRKKLVVKTKG